ncbi:MAG: tetratricopeptide repeat protein, partial [Planctomycetes bacterium]|nr:tetratricopeptide repeat protein [Planctomycetota bacterium]
MRNLTLSLIFVGLLAPAASARIWSDATGQAKVDAEYLGVENGQVKLKFNRTGKVAAMPIGALSEEDQKFVQEQIALEEEKKASANGPPDRFTKLIMQDATNPSHYIARGRARTSNKEYDNAIKDFTKAIELNPQDPDAFNGRGKAYHKKNDLIPAQRDFNQAIQLDAKFAPAYRNRGENLRQLALNKGQSVPELDQAIERWQQFMNHAHKNNMKRAPWQPLNATKGDVSRPAVLQQMAKIDIEWANWLDREHGDYGHGGHGHAGHGPGCNCGACSGDGCPYCDGSGCPACGGGKPAPGLGVYPPQCMKGETVTLVANASQLMKGMPAEAKPGEKPGPNAPKIPLDSVDFYRDVNGDGLFNATDDQYIASDSEHGDGFTTEVSTAAFPPGPQSFFAVPRGDAGSGSGATPEELLSAAEACEKAKKTEEGIAQACEAGKAQGLSEDQSKSLGGDQSGISDEASELLDKVAGACPEAADLLKEAAKPMKAVQNRMKYAQKKPGEACKEDAEKACDDANEAAEKLTKAAEKLREA